MLDATAPAVMIGQILGRWGNFFNAEAHGSQLFEGNPLYFIRMGLLPNEESSFRMYYFHPTFLYESIWNLIGFIIINAIYKKKKFDGQIVLMYLAWYGFGRMFIEGLRTDSLTVGVFRISQVVGFLCFVLCTLALVLNLLKVRRARLTACEYAPSYPKFATSASLSSTDESESDIAVAVESSAEEEEQAVEVDDDNDGTHEEASENVNDIKKTEKRFGDLFEDK